MQSIQIKKEEIGVLRVEDVVLRQAISTIETKVWSLKENFQECLMRQTSLLKPKLQGD